MCTLTHFAQPHPRHTNGSSPLHSMVLGQQDFLPEEPLLPRFQVVLAGNAFFHIREYPPDVSEVSAAAITKPAPLPVHLRHAADPSFP